VTVKHESKTGNDRRTYDLTSLLGKEPRRGVPADLVDRVEDEIPERYRATTESDWSETADQGVG
jgi:hypothetical protein